MDTLSKFTFPAIFGALTLVFGFWLSWVGKPYNSLLFNLHKLIALGGVVLTGIHFSKTLHAPDWLLVVLLLVLVLCALVLFISGGLLSAGKLDYQIMKVVHNLALAFLLASLALTFYFWDRV